LQMVTFLLKVLNVSIKSTTWLFFLNLLVLNHIDFQMINQPYNFVRNLNF
jgi:hypothetical protein